MKLYKLTDVSGYTRNFTLWKEGTTHNLKPCTEPKLCTKTVIHAYDNLNLALLLNRIHAQIKHPVIWEADGEVIVRDWGKVGCFSLTTLRELKCPDWYHNEKKRRLVVPQFAILCAEAALPAYKKEHPKALRFKEAIEEVKTTFKLMLNSKPISCDNINFIYNELYPICGTLGMSKNWNETRDSYFAGGVIAKTLYSISLSAVTDISRYDDLYNAATAAMLASNLKHLNINFGLFADQAVKIVETEYKNI